MGWKLRDHEVGGLEKTQVTYQYPKFLGKKNPRNSELITFPFMEIATTYCKEDQFILKITTLEQGIIMINRSFKNN